MSQIARSPPGTPKELIIERHPTVVGGAVSLFTDYQGLSGVVVVINEELQ